ncbi:ABC transporter ATP-binding protein [Staphylococcus pseudintermedius]|uniref:ABC transporter ATP-binding protein n=7 Tax=Staphylococcus pseudintermedius TaxID=283734 RepID=A0A3D8ZD43_STAPS|nr:ABC transporter ATP-binding protein [Staphylococcus pseudintermedius]EGQ1590618.1 ABC transporter ATP-binding protein [Staphylococcus pseudintermedius]EGQ1679096.1 ABC transporter ATP-binding protein [Staphylococcus pseudintermedius]EGQ2729947.1 ABC transporter ATP-binding protein [Staphylococcus pseudintermedius]EGQ3175758.1 ABC transporter ATP-binding protein [Staphylococcus pseudintermedius]EGQ3242286.1 ABC transporter ATP-binding protein [Staphylococcus pseudintermedius]
MDAITSSKLTKKYGSKKVVDEVSLSITKGTIFGFLGKNGAGKSTFINMITGLCKPTSGEYKLNCENIYKKVGVLPDYSSMYGDLTGKEHIKYFSNILNVKMSNNEIDDLFDSVGLKEGKNLKIKKYSFGMKKKLGIAQSLINKPEILFLDEPTSGVDANSILTIHKLIREVSKNGTTIFITSHNLDEIEKLCDEVAIMSGGQILTQGSLEQLRKIYEENLHLTIEHSDISLNTKNNIERELYDAVSDIKNLVIGEKKSTIEMNFKKHIPIVVKILVHNGIGIYQIKQKELSLEEIFLKSEN